MNNELEMIKVELENANSMSDIKSNPVVESVLMPVIKSVPIIGDMVDSTMNMAIKNFQQKKEQELINVILKNKNIITSDMVNDIEFIVNYNRTLEAVRRLATNDKVKFFGNLIRNGYLSGTHINNNEFEEYLNILNVMSYREIHFLEEYYIFCIKSDKNLHGQLCCPDFEKYNMDKYKLTETDTYSLFIKGVNMGFLFEFQIAMNIDKLMKIKEPRDVYTVDHDGFCIDDTFIKFRDIVLKMDD